MKSRIYSETWLSLFARMIVPEPLSDVELDKINEEIDVLLREKETGEV